MTLTLNEFKDLLKWDREAILINIKSAEDERDRQLQGIINQKNFDEIVMTIYKNRAKLELIDWVIGEASKIEENSKTKFREFL